MSGHARMDMQQIRNSPAISSKSLVSGQETQLAICNRSDKSVLRMHTHKVQGMLLWA